MSATKGGGGKGGGGNKGVRGSGGAGVGAGADVTATPHLSLGRGGRSRGRGRARRARGSGVRNVHIKLPRHFFNMVQSGAMRPVGIEEFDGSGAGIGRGGGTPGFRPFSPWNRGRGRGRSFRGRGRGRARGRTARSRGRGRGRAGRGRNPAGAGAVTTLPHAAQRSTPPLNCLHFVRYGQCRRGAYCAFTHDPTSVAICPRFLSTVCNGPCPRQHEVVESMVPDCAFFLRGRCDRSNCPYRHVAIDPAAPVCKAFVFGVCKEATCPHLHMYLCPEYYQGDECPRGRNCPLDHSRRHTAASAALATAADSASAALAAAADSASAALATAADSASAGAGVVGTWGEEGREEEGDVYSGEDDNSSGSDRGDDDDDDGDDDDEDEDEEDGDEEDEDDHSRKVRHPQGTNRGGKMRSHVDPEPRHLHRGHRADRPQPARGVNQAVKQEVKEEELAGLEPSAGGQMQQGVGTQHTETGGGERRKRGRGSAGHRQAAKQQQQQQQHQQQQQQQQHAQVKGEIRTDNSLHEKGAVKAKEKKVKRKMCSKKHSLAEAPLAVGSSAQPKRPKTGIE